MVNKWVCLNGQLMPENQASIPITDRGFLFGDGLFTTLRVEQGQVEFWQSHLERLVHQCHQLRLIFPRLDFKWIEELIRLNLAHKGIWRLKMMITGGDERYLSLPLRQSSIQLLTLQSYKLEPFTPCRLTLYPSPIVKPTAHLKSLSYLDRLYVYDYANLKGYDDAVVCNCEAYLLETAFSNLFWIKNCQLYIPDPSLSYLQGIFLTNLIKYLKFPIHFFKGGIEDIPNEATIFISNSLNHLRPVTEIDHRIFSRHLDLEKQLQEVIQLALSNNRYP
ncbi:aminotransferase class IV [Candidatus Protochlamydia amoebophila]|uniref:Aminodeoxychorismate lyase n=1 Tax=Protochlamydia amoebophila (strain UWE25) TaxID=264201 RepID=A0A2P9HA22_PARUW|nr:aminotransferase class IV [Candidatus Protochlamydia amoebophila]SPJ31833.1 unnamed protein product [Candidatus Protochlamydia amoebophila UWE25]